jgi:hypothetical protein
MKDVVISGTTKSRQGAGQDYPRPPPGPKTCYQQIEHEELKQYECEPVTAFQGAQLMEELWRGSQKQEEDKGGQQLDHRLMTNHFPERSFSDRLEQPATNHEETGQTKEIEDTVKPHQRAIQAEIADMSIDHEDHRESPHRINVFYPLLCHSTAKLQKKDGTFGYFNRKCYFCRKISNYGRQFTRIPVVLPVRHGGLLPVPDEEGSTECVSVRMLILVLLTG